MEDIFKAIWMGIVQGITEFLPVSSSGHLKIMADWMGQPTEMQQAFDVAVHFSTLLVVMLIYKNRYVELSKQLFVDYKNCKTGNITWKQSEPLNIGIQIILASIPTGLIGICLKDYMEKIPLVAVGGMLLLTGVILSLPHLLKAKKELPALKPWHFGVIIGLAQSLAILPGISRSGTTITVALLLGASRSFAGLFSFLIMIPAVGGAMLLHLKEVDSIPFDVVGAGFIAAFVAGFLSLKFLLKLLNQGKFIWFSPYCMVLGLVVVIKSLFF